MLIRDHRSATPRNDREDAKKRRVRPWSGPFTWPDKGEVTVRARNTRVAFCALRSYVSYDPRLHTPRYAGLYTAVLSADGLPLCIRIYRGLAYGIRMRSRIHTPPSLPCLRRSVFFLRTILDPPLVTIIFTHAVRYLGAFVWKFCSVRGFNYSFFLSFFSFFYRDVFHRLRSFLCNFMLASFRITDRFVFVSFFFTNFLLRRSFARQINPQQQFFYSSYISSPRLIFTSLLHFQFLFPATFLSAELPFLSTELPQRPNHATPANDSSFSRFSFLRSSLAIHLPRLAFSVHPFLFTLCLSLLTNFSLLPVNRIYTYTCIYIYIYIHVDMVIHRHRR